MTHEEALNRILSNSCGLLGDQELCTNGGIQEFRIECHCDTLIVKAKPIGNLKYQIISVEKER